MITFFANRVAAEVCSLPSSTVSMAVWAVTETIDFQPLTDVVMATQTVYNCAMLVQQYRSLNGDGWINTALKIAIFGLLVEEAAAAVTVVGSCPGFVYENIANGLNCYESGKPVNECIHLLDRGSRQVTQLTRHDSDFSTLILRHNDRFCISSSVEPKRMMTVCCKPHFQKCQAFEQAGDFIDLRVHELPLRHSNLTIRISDSSSSDDLCGIQLQRPADYNLGREPICLLTASRSCAEITQICLDPNNPFAHTVQAIAKDKFPMDFSARSGKPLVFVASNWKELGLKLHPDRSSKEDL
jgi:hypothetical protein